MQADALSHLHTSAETIADDVEELPTFTTPKEGDDTQEPVFLSMDNVHTDTSDEDDEISSNDLEESFAADAAFATLPGSTLSNPLFQQISIEELIITQQSAPFCQNIRQKHEEGAALTFGFNEDGVIIQKGKHGPQIVISNDLEARVLHIHHYARLGGHPGGRKLYQTIRRHMYWPACAVDCYATARRCPTCDRNRIKLRNNVTEL